MGKPQSTALRAVCYARCSTDRQEDSVERQAELLAAYAAAEGYALGPVFADDGVSGADLSRPGLDALLAHVEGDRLGGVVLIEHPDRIGRWTDARRAGALELRLEDAGWQVVYLTGSVSTGDELADSLLRTTTAAQAGKVAEATSAKTIGGMVRRLRSGCAPGGRVPYGYASELVGPDGTVTRVARTEKRPKRDDERSRWVLGDEAEGATVRRIFSTVAAGGASFASLAAEFNAEGVPSPSGGRWGASTIRAMVNRYGEVFAGHVVWNRSTHGKRHQVDGEGRPVKRKGQGHAANAEADWIVLRDRHPALVSDELLAQARAAVADRRGGSRKAGAAPAASRYPLSGLVVCGRCGGPMHGHGSREARYLCSTYKADRGSCDCLSIGAARLERAVLTKIREALGPVDVDALRARLVERLAGSAPRSTTDLAALERRRDELARRIDGALDRLVLLDDASAAALAEKVKGWRTDLDHVEAKLAAVPTSPAWAEQAADEGVSVLRELAEAGLEAPPEARRRVYRRAVDRVELSWDTTQGPKRKRHRFRRGVLTLAASVALVVGLAGSAEGAEPAPVCLVSTTGGWGRAAGPLADARGSEGRVGHRERLAGDRPQSAAGWPAGT